MARKEAYTCFLVIGAWVMGALMGSVIHRPTAARTASAGIVRFDPGLYLLEEPMSGFQWVGRFEYTWSVRRLTETPRE